MGSEMCIRDRTSFRRPAQGAGFAVNDAGTFRTLGETDQPDEAFAVLTTRDPNNFQVVENPLALATASGNVLFQQAGVPELAGFAAGLATCAGAECGADRNGDNVGESVYGVRGETSFRFNDGSLTGQDDNSVRAEIELFSDGTAASTTIDSAGLTFLAEAGNGSNTAYIDDETFAGLYRPGTTIAAGPGGQVGSPGAAGVFGFASLPDTDQFLGAGSDSELFSFGVWAAAYSVPDVSLREDAVPSGIFVVGAPGALADLPFEGVASYSGPAVGNRVDAGGSVTVATGSFSLDFDFAVGEGFFDLEIAEFSDIVGSAFSNGNTTFALFGGNSNISASGDGGFFSGPGSSAEAIGGNFGILDQGNGIQVEGVFGAEVNFFDPDGSLFNSVPASSGAFLSENFGAVLFESTIEDFGIRGGNGLVGGSSVETIQITIPPNANEFIEETGPGAGFFAFDDGSSTLQGQLSGFGFSDLDENFHAFATLGIPDPAAGPQGGLFVLGNASPGQAAVPLFGTGGLDGGNVVTPLLVDQNLVSGQVDGDPGINAFLVSNVNEARFTNSTTTDDANGGRIAAASFQGGSNASGGFSQVLSVFAGGLFNDGTEGLQFRGEGLSTETADPIFPAATSLTLSAVEDIDGNTVFGTDTQRFVLSSFVREEQGSGFEFVPQARTQINNNVDDIGALAQVATIDEANSVGIENPFPNALNPLSATSQASQASQTDPLPILTGFTSARVQCGGCGTFTFVQPPGNTDSFLLEGTATFAFDPNLNGTDTNSLTAVFDTTSDGTDNTGSNSLQYTFAAPLGASTAFADDQTFVGTSGPTVASVTTAGSENESAQFGFASGNALGETGLFRASAEQPEFVTWGLWNASYEQLNATGAVRRDILSAGVFVAGAPTVINDVPLSGVAQYNGIAVGQRQDLDSPIVHVVGGTTSLTYDFGTDQGTFDLTIDQVGAPGVAEFDISTLVFEGDAANIYQGFQETSGFQADIQGQFFVGGDDPVGATAGTFNISDQVNNVVVDGVFGADRQP